VLLAAHRHGIARAHHPQTTINCGGNRQNDHQIDRRHGAARLALSATGLPLGKPVAFLSNADINLDAQQPERRSAMAVTLNRRAFDHAKALITEGRIVFENEIRGSEHRPSAQKENQFLRLHGFAEYGKWYFGINDEKSEGTKGHYEFPYGDFANVHRCGALAAESRAGQYKHDDIENAAAHLHGMIEGRKGSARDTAATSRLPWQNGTGARHPAQ
jgi:hypothetical protein